MRFRRFLASSTVQRWQWVHSSPNLQQGGTFIKKMQGLGMVKSAAGTRNGTKGRAQKSEKLSCGEWANRTQVKLLLVAPILRVNRIEPSMGLGCASC